MIDPILRKEILQSSRKINCTLSYDVFKFQTIFKFNLFIGRWHASGFLLFQLRSLSNSAQVFTSSKMKNFQPFIYCLLFVFISIGAIRVDHGPLDGSDLDRDPDSILIVLNVSQVIRSEGLLYDMLFIHKMFLKASLFWSIIPKYFRCFDFSYLKFPSVQLMADMID